MINLSEPLSIGFSMILVVLFSYTVTGLVRRYSLQHSLIDKPNDRSSHVAPTPRGGGLSISISVLVSIYILMEINYLPRNISIAMLGGGCLVTIVGWLDDHRDISVLWRGCSYVIASIWALYFIDSVGQINLGEPIIINVGLAASIIIVIAIAWLVNLYNFMDGTDGIAAIQAVSSALPAGVIFWLNSEPGLAVICFVIVSACVGFLFWNWSPAKIFMGDVCSCLIGFIFGVLAIAGEHTNTIPIAVWLILLSVFIWDTTFTLLKRILMGEKWYVAHRSHAYQRLNQLGVSHSSIAIFVFILNVTIIWPLVYAAYKWDNIMIYLLVFSIILMFILWSGIQIIYRARMPHVMGETS